MLKYLSDYHLLYIDIETVGTYPSYFDMPERIRKLWDKKAQTLNYKGDKKPIELFERAGIYAEFGKIVCISVGYVPQSSQKTEDKKFLWTQ
jgi:hypothetical protein